MIPYGMRVPVAVWQCYAMLLYLREPVLFAALTAVTVLGKAVLWRELYASSLTLRFFGVACAGDYRHESGRVCRSAGLEAIEREEGSRIVLNATWSQ